MANLNALPTELLSPIVGHLRDRRINVFDPVATKDLQSLRLVSRKVMAIATPMLFENMVYDLKLYRKQDVNGFPDFVRANPEVAKHVRCVHVKIPPAIEIWSPLRFRGVDTAASTPHAREVYNTLNRSARVWKSSQEMEERRIREGTSATLEIATSLPNLRHLEHGISTYYQQEIANIQYRILASTRNLTESHYLVSATRKPQVLALGFLIALINAVDSIISLKLRGLEVWTAPNTFMIPSHLRHLDLEILVGPNLSCNFESQSVFIVEEYTYVKMMYWRRRLGFMKQLKTLRIGLGYQTSAYEKYERDHRNHFYVDTLLEGFDDAKEICCFPDLTSLELFDCDCRWPGLLTVVESLQQRLKKLILNRVTLAPGYSGPSLCEVKETCKDVVPGLEYLRLTKLVTSYHPKPFNHSPDRGANAEPTAKGRGSRLEDARTYEWTRGRAGGTDEEFIGFKCPWT